MALGVCHLSPRVRGNPKLLAVMALPLLIFCQYKVFHGRGTSFYICISYIHFIFMPELLRNRQREHSAILSAFFLHIHYFVQTCTLVKTLVLVVKTLDTTFEKHQINLIIVSQWYWSYLVPSCFHSIYLICYPFICHFSTCLNQQTLLQYCFLCEYEFTFS